MVRTAGAGEEIAGSILELARERRFKGGTQVAIGAVGEAWIGFFVPEEKRYREVRLRENLEIVSLHGNLALVQGEPVLHAHVVLGRAEFSTIGGHLFAATFSVTDEIVLTPTAKPVRRALDGRFGLKLLRLG